MVNRIQLWFEVGYTRVFLIPAEVDLSSGDIVIRRMTGEERHVDPKAIAAFEVDRARAQAWIQERGEMVIGAFRTKALDFFGRIGKAIRASLTPADPPAPPPRAEETMFADLRLVVDIVSSSPDDQELHDAWVRAVAATKGGAEWADVHLPDAVTDWLAEVSPVSTAEEAAARFEELAYRVEQAGADAVASLRAIAQRTRIPSFPPSSSEGSATPQQLISPQCQDPPQATSHGCGGAPLNLLAPSPSHSLISAPAEAWAPTEPDVLKAEQATKEELDDCSDSPSCAASAFPPAPLTKDSTSPPSAVNSCAEAQDHHDDPPASNPVTKGTNDAPPTKPAIAPTPQSAAAPDNCSLQTSRPPTSAKNQRWWLYLACVLVVALLLGGVVAALLNLPGIQEIFRSR